MPLTFQSAFVAIKNLVMGDNVRLPGSLNIEGLKADIEENGLLTPITVFELEKGDHLVIRGHRRTTSLQQIFAGNPKRFKKLFPKGVPVTVLKGISQEEAELMKVDDSQYQPLTDPFEIQLCANKLFAFKNAQYPNGLTEREVALRMAGILDRIYPMKATKKKKAEELKADIALAQAKGLVEVVKTKTKELNDLIFEYRRGKMQNCHEAFRCPDIVMSALQYKATGNLPDGWNKKVYLPATLNYGHVKKLWTEFKKDLQLDAEKKGSLKYNKRSPGPNFLSKWNEICEELKADETAPKTTRAMAMSAKAMKEQKWFSTFGSKLTAQHGGDKEVNPDDLTNLDLIAYYAEIIAERAPKEWDELVKLATGLEKEMEAERKEAAAK